jgi:hypothetical protein
MVHANFAAGRVNISRFKDLLGVTAFRNPYHRSAYNLSGQNR